MTETLRALILSRQAGAVSHAAAYLLVAVSAVGLILIFTGRPHLAPAAMLTALSSLAVFGLFSIAALPVLISMVYIAYACIRSTKTKNPEPPP